MKNYSIAYAHTAGPRFLEKWFVELCGCMLTWLCVSVFLCLFVCCLFVFCVCLFVFVLFGWLFVCARFVYLFVCFSANVGKSGPECMPEWPENRSKMNKKERKNKDNQ